MAKRILIVEDNLNNLKLEKDLFAIAGHVTLEATDAETGIELAKNELPDLIVMDIRLPGMRGVEAARIIRADEKTKNIPIVFVTASAMLGEDIKAKSIPLCGYITKPINTRTFVEEVTEYLPSC